MSDRQEGWRLRSPHRSPRSPSLACVLLALLVIPVRLSAQKRFSTKDLSKLVADLGNSMDSNIRYAAYRKLIRTRPPKAVPLLVKALPAYPQAAQSLALSLLQGYPRDLSQPAFRKLLDCGAPLVEIGSAIALHRFGDKSQGKRIARMIAKAPRHDNLRQLMLSRIGYLRDERVQAAVRALLVPGVTSSELDTILYHLLINEDPKAADAAFVLYGSEGLDESSRLVLGAFLIAKGRSVDASRLAEILPTTRDFYRLQKYLSRADHLDKRILAAVADYLEHNQRSTYASYAISLLARHRYRKAIPTIRKLVTSTNSTVSKAAFSALRDLGGFSNKSSLYQLLDSKSPDVVLSAADTLRRMDDATGLDAVLQVVKKGGRTRSEAVRVLAEFRDAKVVVPLFAALEDKDSAVRSQAYTGLGKVFRCLYPYKRIDLSKSGYSVNAGPTKRAIAVANLRAWWGGLRGQ